MENPRSLLTASIAAFAVVMGIGTYGMLSYFGNNGALQMAASAVPYEELTYAPSMTDGSRDTETRSITATHATQGDTHWLSGELLLDNACAHLSVDAVPHETIPPFVEISFTTSISDTEESCPPASSPTPFSLTFSAPQNALFVGTWNGEDAILSLIKE